jgi:predicted DNA binding protein/GAF domain-containing protein
VYGPGVPGPDIVLPMGSHGVMLVGAPDEQFGAEEVELAQILAATLEAALNHVAGERALAEREAELQRQQARADQLEQLNTIIRDIEQATVEQSSRAGIEEAVCERLVDVDRHDVVWVAEPAVGDDGLVPRTSAGGAEGYVDGLTSVVGSAADPGGHPAVAAHRTGELHAVENVATDISGGEWRKHALGHGVQSVVAVPIRYETTTHGVLTVASADPDAFDEATRDVLAELGRSIGYAITVTEREQALESDGTTELEFDVADEGLFMIRGATTADCRVALERTIRRTGGSFSMFYTVEGAEPAAVVDLADAAPSVATAQVVSSNEAEAGGLVEVTAPTWFGSVFTEHGAVVREATATPDGGTLLVEAPRGTDVRALVEGFQERYPDAELVAQRQRDRTIRSLFELQDALETELTDRQWEALETAYSAGYFSWPRETSGQEVAELLGVSQPTFNKHLRIAEQSAFRMLLDREYPAADE